MTENNQEKTNSAPKRTIALVAHDNMKTELLEWAAYNKGTLAQTNIVATGTTGSLLTQKLELPVRRMLSGPLGGDQQIGAMIADQQIDMLIFFWDPLEAQPHDPDVKALLRMATVWNIPTATNIATADYLISSPLFTGSYKPIQPDFQNRNSSKA